MRNLQSRKSTRSLNPYVVFISEHFLHMFACFFLSLLFCCAFFAIYSSFDFFLSFFFRIFSLLYLAMFFSLHVRSVSSYTPFCVSLMRKYLPLLRLLSVVICWYAEEVCWRWSLILVIHTNACKCYMGGECMRVVPLLSGWFFVRRFFLYFFVTYSFDY